MDTSLRMFISQFVGVIVTALVPVILIAFLSIPFTLGGHPGEPLSPGSPFSAHMT